MCTKRILIILIFVCSICTSRAQVSETAAEADAHSLQLFNAADWKNLLIYGKAQIATGNSFALLRMRTGYAALMQKNYSQSLLQYQKVYDADANNTTALYYVYLNNLYLNNTTAAQYYAQKLSAETKATEKIRGTKFSGLQIEFSNKMPNDTARRAAQYARVGFNIDLGYRLQLQQSVAYYTLLQNTAPASNTATYVRLKQPEYYAKLIYAVNGQWSLLGAYHYIGDKFPDTTLKSNIFFGGVKYSSPYFSIQADASGGKFAVNYTQFDAIFTLYPLGNLNVYSISRISLAQLKNAATLPATNNSTSNTQTNFTQIVGVKLSKNIWAEANTTLGKASYLFENDALYVKNDPDLLKFKAGASLYTLLSKKLLLTLNYTLEQKQKQFSIINNNYYQHSINGGLTWKF